MISWSRVVRSMAGVSWTDVPASAVRVRRPVAIRGKPVMAAKLGNFPSSAHPSPLPVKDTEKTVSGMDSEQSATGGRGKVAEESSTDFLPSMSPTAGGVSGGVSRHEALLPTEGFGEVSLETTSSMEGIFTETPAFLDSRCLPVHTLGPPSISKPLGANVETPLRPVPLTARLCGATPQSTPAMDPPLLQLSSLLLAASVPSSSAVSRGHWGACPLAVPANAFRLQLSLPELLSTLPQVSMETSEPLSTTPVIETSDGSEVCTNVLRPDPTGCQTDDRTHEPTRRRVAAAFPRRFPSTTFKVGAPPVFDRDLPSTAECTGDRAKMAVDPPPPPSCAHGTSKEAAFEGTDEASVSRESFPTPKAVPRSRPSLSTQGKVEMEDSSVNVHRRKNVQRGKRPRSRGDTGTQVDFPAESPSPPMEDTSFLFAMDVEGLLLEKEAKRRRTRKCKTLSAYSTSSCESSEEELDTRTARKKRKELSRKNRGKKGVKPKKPVPNAFVSVRIPSPQISEKIGEVQKGMLLSDKKLKSALVSLDKLHLTLMVLRLEGEEAVERWVWQRGVVGGRGKEVVVGRCGWVGSIRLTVQVH